jgi:hypothetical protein
LEEAVSPAAVVGAAVGVAGKAGFAAHARIRSRAPSVADFLIAICAIASVVSPWAISIPPAHLAQSFGFQTPACWVAVIALLAALVLDARAAVVALGAVELVLITWFGWAMWVVTTPRFADLGFQFVGTDLMGPGWYVVAVGVLLAAAAVVKELNDREVPVGVDLWILTAIPGFGLMRLGQWSRGLMWTALFSAAFYFASTDSPDPTQFADFGRYGNVPPAYPRGPEWTLLGLAALLFAISIAVTAWQGRRVLQTEPDWA